MTYEGEMLATGFDSIDFQQQFWRSLSAVWNGCADIGECFATAGRIADGDIDSWSAAWRATAERVQAGAAESRGRGHRVSARDGYLRATEYHRQAIWFRRDDLDNADLQRGLADLRDCFGAAAALADAPAEQVEIPFEGGSLPGWLHRPDDSGAARPVLLVPGGYDSFAEEMYGMLGRGGVRRGYAVLTFDAPGQGTALIARRLYMRPDFETVVAPVIDWLAAQPGIDPARIVLCGFSFGGYLAPRAAASERRLAALVANPGQVDIGSGLASRLPPPIAEMWHRGDRAGMDAAFAELFARDPMRRFYFRSRMAVHGIDSVFDYCNELQRFTLAGRLGDIACPTLVLDNPGDTVSVVGNAFHDGLTCDKTLVSMVAADGYGAHCQAGATAYMERILFDWLDERLAA
ncbi:MAG: alpha/beta fold hydrolase [Sneathiellaceae bacterium]